MKIAMFWDARAEGSVQCQLCHQRCLIRTGRRGLCGVRENREGTLYSLVYGRLTAEAVDPIEKKPLYHFLPGSTSLSVATRGCNFKCRHCQNCTISQVVPGESFDQGAPVEPRQIVQSALARGCRSLSYTYTEPTVFFEYAYDTARLAAAQGLKNVFVTNGYITPEALREIAPYLDAANIDLKFFSEKLYREVCGARLQPVLDMIRLYHELHIWIEVATLVIPTYNDSEDQLRLMAEFIAALDGQIPWHLTAFHPMYMLAQVPATPLATLRRARRIGLDAGLKHVYLGNVADEEGSATRCPACGAAVIQRPIPGGIPFGATDGICPACGHSVNGVWNG
jgi:pyruvate formate lyase activating enzyme